MGENLQGVARDIKFTPAAGDSNVCEVTMQVVDAYGNNVNEVLNFLVYLSDSASGEGLTDTSASGNVEAVSGYQDLGALTAKKALMVQTDSTGKYVLSITDSSKTNFYVCAVVPGGKNDGRVSVSAQLATANYG